MSIVLQKIIKIKKRPVKGRFGVRSVCFERKQSGDARAFDGDCKHSLVLCAGTRHAAGEDLSALADEFAELGNVLIIDFGLFLTEQTDLFHVLFFIALLRGSRFALFRSFLILFGRGRGGGRRFRNRGFLDFLFPDALLVLMREFVHDDRQNGMSPSSSKDSKAGLRFAAGFSAAGAS